MAIAIAAVGYTPTGKNNTPQNSEKDSAATVADAEEPKEQPFYVAFLF